MALFKALTVFDIIDPLFIHSHINTVDGGKHKFNPVLHMNLITDGMDQSCDQSCDQTGISPIISRHYPGDSFSNSLLLFINTVK